MMTGTSAEQWRVRRKWLAIMLFGFGMTVGEALGSIVIPMLVVAIAGARAAWLFHRHRFTDTDGVMGE